MTCWHAHICNVKTDCYKVLKFCCLLVFKNDSKQVMMMNQKSKFSFAYHPDVKLKVTAMFLVNLVIISDLKKLTLPQRICTGPGASIRRGGSLHDYPAA